MIRISIVHAVLSLGFLLVYGLLAIGSDPAPAIRTLEHVFGAGAFWLLIAAALTLLAILWLARPPDA